MQITTIGLDLAKSIFQVHGVDARGRPVIRKALRRAQVLLFFERLAPCLVGIEACSSAHYWARELSACGHTVKLMPPSYVKPYVKRGKNDAADAEAICEAVTRATMRFVPVKAPEQQAAVMLHRTRALLMRQRIMVVNALRGHLAEFGLIAPQGAKGLADLLERTFRPDGTGPIPSLARARTGAASLAGEATPGRHQDDRCGASGLASSECRQPKIGDDPGHRVHHGNRHRGNRDGPLHFQSGRQFAAWLGLVPRQSSSGGKERLGSISKMGDRYLRTLLVVGATSVIRYARGKNAAGAAWINGLLARRPARLVSVALANKTARIAWAVLTEERDYRKPALMAA